MYHKVALMVAKRELNKVRAAIGVTVCAQLGHTALEVYWRFRLRRKKLGHVVNNLLCMHPYIDNPTIGCLVEESGHTPSVVHGRKRRARHQQRQKHLDALPLMRLVSSHSTGARPHRPKWLSTREP